MNELWYVATGTFTRANPGWAALVEKTGLTHVSDFVSLDSVLCPLLIETIERDETDHLVAEFPYRYFFNDLDFVVDRTRDIEEKNVLAVVHNPEEEQADRRLDGFTFTGYDLVDVQTGKSLLSGGKAYVLAFSPDQLNLFGLLRTFDEAEQVRTNASVHYPDDPRVQVDLWAIWRMENG